MPLVLISLNDDLDRLINATGPGDKLEIEISAIGTLENPIAAG